MKLGMFKDAKSLAEWCRREASLIENNGLRLASQELEHARSGVGKKEFFEMNLIEEERADEAWQNHIDWLEGRVEYLKKKIRKLRKKAEIA